MERFIFCINAGRSGSGYLASLLDSSVECRCFHECYPNFAGYAIRKVNIEGFEETLDFQMVKINFIRKTQIDKPVYGDTSHVFIKSWFLAAAKTLPKVKVVWLRRKKDEIVRSMLRLSSIPDKSVGGQNWYLRTDYKFNLTDSKIGMTNEETCRWYVDEIEARAEYFKRRFPEIPVYEIYLDDLNDEKNVFSLMYNLGLTPTEKTNLLIGGIRNKKLPEKRDLWKKTYYKLKRTAIPLNPFRSRKRIHITGNGYYV